MPTPPRLTPARLISPTFEIGGPAATAAGQRGGYARPPHLVNVSVDAVPPLSMIAAEMKSGMIIPCPVCKNGVSNVAYHCQACGHPIRPPLTFGRVVFNVFLLGFLVFLCWVFLFALALRPH